MTDLRRQVIDSISRSADALTRLIYNLLAMGRAEEGRLLLHRTAVSLPTLFDEMLVELAVYHPGIVKRLQRHLPDVQVDVDPDYIKLVISNIVDNAVKYSPPKSSITVTGDSQRSSRWPCISTIPAWAFPPQELHRIFDLYETTGTAPHSLRRGVGLGLYMARLLIEAHGGAIWAESQEDEGAARFPSLSPDQVDQQHRQHHQCHHDVKAVLLQREGDDREDDAGDGGEDQQQQAELDDCPAIEREHATTMPLSVCNCGGSPWKCRSAVDLRQNGLDTGCPRRGRRQRHW